jgi:alkylated DNA repair protein alkB family protein 4
MLNEIFNYCVCKGIRTCLKCEELKSDSKITKKVVDLTKYLKCNEQKEFYLKFSDIDFNLEILETLKEFLNTGLFRVSQEIDLELNKVFFDSSKLFEGLFLIENFITDNESEQIYKEMISKGWVQSQSGRMKQDYGPKINYKKRKIKFDDALQFPDYLQKIIKDRLKEQEILKDFKVEEIGNLFYSSENGASIDPHIDHYFVWGRIVGINMLSDCVITFSHEIDINKSRKNIHDDTEFLLNFEINIPLPINCAYIMTGNSRYLWKHSIKRENIKSKRIVITMREYERNFDLSSKK